MPLLVGVEEQFTSRAIEIIREHYSVNGPSGEFSLWTHENCASPRYQVAASRCELGPIASDRELPPRLNVRQIARRTCKAAGMILDWLFSRSLVTELVEQI